MVGFATTPALASWAATWSPEAPLAIVIVTARPAGTFAVAR